MDLMVCLPWEEAAWVGERRKAGSEKTRDLRVRTFGGAARPRGKLTRCLLVVTESP